MTELDFCFEEPLWQRQLQSLEKQGCISAAQFLTVLEPEDQLAAEEAFSWLDEQHITLNIDDLPPVQLTGTAALRLKQEEQQSLADVTQGLDPNDPLLLYLQEVSMIPAAGDPQLLAERYSAGEHHVAEQLVNNCLSMVTQQAMAYTGHGVLLLDLIQEGSMGLWQSIIRYESGDFVAHAQWWIRHFMAKAVTSYARSSGVGLHLLESMQDYVDADQRLLTELGRNPVLEEIADALHISVQQAATVEKMVTQARSLQKIKMPEPEPTLEDEQAVEDTAYFQLRQRIAELLSVLPEQDAKLLTLRFGLEGGQPLTPVQTGEILNMTPQEVVRREAAALSRLRSV